MEKKEYKILILVLSALSAIGPFSIDMYLPGFPSIASDFKTDIAKVGFSLSSFFVGIAVGQIAYGPIMDRFGRKKPMIIGLIIYILAALGCALSSSIYLLIGLRFLLALGASGGMTGSRAVVFDLFRGSEAARVLSTLMVVFGIAPVIAPTIGGIVVETLGWRYLFVILALLATSITVAVAIYLRETKHMDASFSLQPKYVFLEYLTVFKDRTFLKYTLISAAGMAGFFSYITCSAFVYTGLLGFTAAQFGWIYGINVIGLIIASQVNRIWLKKSTGKNILIITTVAQFLGIWMLFLFVFTGFGGKSLIIGLIFFYLFCLGFISPNATSMALQPFTRNTGSAVALIGFLQMVAAASISGLVSFLHNNTAIPMVLAMTICTTIGLLTLCWSKLKIEK